MNLSRLVFCSRNSNHHQQEKILFGPPVNESEIIAPAEMLSLGDGFKGGNGVIQDGINRFQFLI
jgi:hypothetical protein